MTDTPPQGRHPARRFAQLLADVVGFDDTPLAEHVHPSLTTIRRDPMAAGSAAAALLLQRLGGPTLPAIALPPPVLVVRDSTGPPPRGDAQLGGRTTGGII